jgi:hypothetical protein
MDGGVNPYEPLGNVGDKVPRRPGQQAATVVEIAARSLPVVIASSLGAGVVGWFFYAGLEDSLGIPFRVMLVFGAGLAVAWIAVIRARRHLCRRDCVVLSAIFSLIVGVVPILVVNLLHLVDSAIPDISLDRELWTFAGGSGVTFFVTVVSALVAGKSVADAEEE